MFVMLYLDIFKWLMLRNEVYWTGLHVVPILLLANLLLGIYYNFSVWYKVTDRTEWGAYISLIGAGITIIFNLIFIPKYSYTAAAWVTLAAYSVMTLLSYFIGQRYYAIPYPTSKMILYIVTAIGCWLISDFLTSISLFSHVGLRYSVHTAIFVAYLLMAYQLEKSSIIKYFFR
ncbi:MAG: hypothetical protein HC892_01275 [Saprospiraceae bacterium]|nr:hypothetical protein [Saprospiraceae bacterium]